MGRCKRKRKNLHCAKIGYSRDGEYPYLKKEAVSCYETFWPSVSKWQDITSQRTASSTTLGGLKVFRTDNKTAFPGRSNDELFLVCKTQRVRTGSELQSARVNVVRNSTGSFETEHEPPDKFRIVIRWHVTHKSLHVAKKRLLMRSEQYGYNLVFWFTSSCQPKQKNKRNWGSNQSNATRTWHSFVI
jgi:hypothetical protein